MEANEVTLYRAGEIAKLPASKQETAVAQWTNRFLMRTEGQAIAARVIREELARANKPISLDELSELIREAVHRAPVVGNCF
jgi:hypothetical protein